ncbi:hypothetical protein FOZ63_002810, partial [Perkinsus olseni]
VSTMLRIGWVILLGGPTSYALNCPPGTEVQNDRCIKCPTATPAYAANCVRLVTSRPLKAATHQSEPSLTRSAAVDVPSAWLVSTKTSKAKATMTEIQLFHSVMGSGFLTSAVLHSSPALHID